VVASNPTIGLMSFHQAICEWVPVASRLLPRAVPVLFIKPPAVTTATHLPGRHDPGQVAVVRQPAPLQPPSAAAMLSEFHHP
jgi:hypothetical protein